MEELRTGSGTGRSVALCLSHTTSSPPTVPANGLTQTYKTHVRLEASLLGTSKGAGAGGSGEGQSENRLLTDSKVAWALRLEVLIGSWKCEARTESRARLAEPHLS